MSATPTVRVVDFSEFRTFGWSIHGFQFIDVIADAFHAERLVVQGPTGLAGRASSRFRRGGRIIRPLPGRARLRLGADPVVPADVLFAYATDLGDLEILSASRDDWSGQHQTKILWISEVWMGDLATRHTAELDYLRDFDLIVCPLQSSMKALERFVKNPIRQLLPAVDVASTPWSSAPSIDFLNIGRRSRTQHEALLAWTDERSGWYHFDTLPPPAVTDPYAHRRVTASLFANAAVSISNYARFDQPEITRGCREVGFRYPEALAAGALIAGDHPTQESFLSDEGYGGLEGVQDLSALLRIEPDELSRLHKLGTTPLVREELRRRACLRHDWAHRIAAILQLLEMKSSDAITRRIRSLADDAPQGAS